MATSKTWTTPRSISRIKKKRKLGLCYIPIFFEATSFLARSHENMIWESFLLSLFVSLFCLCLLLFPFSFSSSSSFSFSKKQKAKNKKQKRWNTHKNKTLNHGRRSLHYLMHSKNFCVSESVQEKNLNKE